MLNLIAELKKIIPTGIIIQQSQTSILITVKKVTKNLITIIQVSLKGANNRMKRVKYLLITIMFLAFIVPKKAVSQTNIMEVDWQKLSDLESGLQLAFKLGATGVEISLKGENVPDGANYAVGCEKDKTRRLGQTIVGLKADKNEIWSFYFALIYDAEGKYTSNAYVGYIKTTYGEQKERYLVKVKKTRLYPENNIYTESIKFQNGITFIIEDRIYVRQVISPKGEILYVEKYYYEDCNAR
ncbi:MAG: hypothetical protein PSX36_09230 [bacterium]|nr:hypothetical protein [bacterium]